MYILCLYVYMVEETMAQLVDGALCAVLVKREILVGVEHYYVVEAESCLVAADKLLVDRVQRQTCTEGEHALLACSLGTLDFCLYGVGDNLRALLHFRIDVGEEFLATCDFRAFNCRTRAVVLLRYLIQYNLRT